MNLLSTFLNFSERAVKVKNNVIWINSNQGLLVNETIGKPSNLPLVVNVGSGEKGVFGFAGTRNKHGRSHDLFQIISDQGVPKAVDVKGGVWFEDGRVMLWDAENIKTAKPDEFDEMSRGLCNKMEAMHDKDKALEILKRGGYCHIPLEIVELQELLFFTKDNNGFKKVPVKKLIIEGELYKGYVPVAYVRSYDIKTRIWDLSMSYRTPELKPKQIKSEMETARNIVCKIHKTQPTWHNYLIIVSYRLGKTLKIIHDMGDLHNELHTGNITLAGEIVDLDSQSSEYEEIYHSGEDPVTEKLELDQIMKAIGELYSFVITYCGEVKIQPLKTYLNIAENEYLK